MLETLGTHCRGLRYSGHAKEFRYLIAGPKELAVGCRPSNTSVPFWEGEGFKVALAYLLQYFAHPGFCAASKYGSREAARKRKYLAVAPCSVHYVVIHHKALVVRPTQQRAC